MRSCFRNFELPSEDAALEKLDAVANNFFFPPIALVNSVGTTEKMLGRSP
jgi:hypothetical protein